MSDLFSREDARADAEAIASYWRERGYPGIRTWVEEQQLVNSERWFFARSNLNGLGWPPRGDAPVDRPPVTLARSS